MPADLLALSRAIADDERDASPLWREAPARALDWLLRVAAHEVVPPLHQLNPLVADAVRTRLAMRKGTPPPRFHGEPQLEWRAWLARDGRCWDETRRVPFDAPFAAAVVW